jgi:N utilization substance protein B
MSDDTPARAHRRAAITVLYLLDAGIDDDPRSLQDALLSAEFDTDARARGLKDAQAMWTRREAIDARITAESLDWPVHRQPTMDRAILRLACWELLHTETPRSVVLDEAVRLAHAFGTERSSAFVNAVLDGLKQDESPTLEQD